MRFISTFTRKLLVLSLVGFTMGGVVGCASVTPSATPTVSTSSQPSASVTTENSDSSSSSAGNSQTATAGAAAIVNTTSPAKSNTSAPKGLVPVVVSKDVDGDTIHVRMPNGKDETIRMLLIDTPETVDPKTPVEPFGPQASSFAKSELPVGRHIYIQEGVTGYTRDKYDRLLAYVYISPTDMYNEDVVKRGLARVAYIYPPNTQHLTELETDQQYAKSHRLGIWSIAGYVTSSGYNMNAVKSGGSAYAGSTSSATTSTKSTSTTGLTVVTSDLSVAPRDYASVTIHTHPGVQGTIEVDYKSGPSHASGLGPQTADSNGNITWRWKVGSSTSAGNWPVHISAGGNSITLTLHVS